jgi:hypothetical protein
MTQAQRHFVEVCRGLVRPVTSHEFAWTKFKKGADVMLGERNDERALAEPDPNPEPIVLTESSPATDECSVDTAEAIRPGLRSSWWGLADPFVSRDQDAPSEDYTVLDAMRDDISEKEQFAASNRCRKYIGGTF